MKVHGVPPCLCPQCEQLRLADELAKAVHSWHLTGRGIVKIGEALEAYRSARGIKKGDGIDTCRECGKPYSQCEDAYK